MSDNSENSSDQSGSGEHNTQSTEGAVESETTDKPASDKLSSDEPVGEMTDREARRKQKKEEREKKRAAQKKKKKSLDQIDQAMAEGRLADRRKAARKKQFKMAAYGVLAVFIGWLGFYLFKPYEADLRYGICRIYLEQSVRFPKYLRMSTVEDVIKSNVDIYPIRIWYTQLDAFGEYRLESIQCEYKYDEERGTIIDRILVNRREVDERKVERFNLTIPIIASNPPDLTYPAPLPDSLEDLQINSDALRLQLNIPGIN